MGNNSLFTRWRPYSHFNAPAGWMNDPCGPMVRISVTYLSFFKGVCANIQRSEYSNISEIHRQSSHIDTNNIRYDPTRDIYHFFYQWHPEHINWGNISWGYATSKDLITFEDHVGWQDSEALALGPTGYGKPWIQHYNGLGIFSGTAQPVNLQGEVDGTLLIMYTFRLKASDQLDTALSPAF